MILINLLPDGYRERNKTPIKFMVAVSSAVALNGTLLAFWAWTAFGVAAEMKSELAVLQDTKAGLEPQVAYHQELKKESGIFEAREKLLHRITSTRVNWTRKLDELVGLVNSGGEEKYLVWFDDLNVEVQENTRSKAFGRLKAEGHTAESFTHVANFLEDVAESKFSDVFGPPRAPEGSASETDEGLVPSKIWTFPLELDLKSPKERRALRGGGV
jgi:Tfp pilus assembly protein PilN